MANRGRGPSYPFWARIQREISEQGITLRELVKRSEVTHTVIGSLAHSGIRDRAARQRNVIALAKALGIPKSEALQLAGLAPVKPDPRVDAREAIRLDPELDDEQKDALFRLLDVFARDRKQHQANEQTG
ncbi:hypothetical protein GCM10010399_43800 [Dactylosporangium fulvum]|uniref:HTH cro/C1-type domain-containing protein n=1 Tax=Dactylosporangium fulvum TaxID=53359 RepID=A0ABY5W7E9_9ACTN|nr:hypothetical protein [Dactylosporangium fulvum]UWP85953.1 hypothetical protein Dfulv_17540 [Dactylosporangium fulvum]